MTNQQATMAEVAPPETRALRIMRWAGDLHCLICGRHARMPWRLHEIGCPHCPCEACHGN
ncbi:MAG: hypothetical protein IT336_14970 [Thermomicrobiales bacterium]|nr:hypothetical protein [Thermomicrobiales bacterium]